MAFPPTSPLTPIAAAIRRPPDASTAGCVQRRAQRTGPAQHPDEPALGVRGDGQRRTRGVEGVEGGARLGIGRDRGGDRPHHLPHLGEPIHLGALRLGHDADRSTAVVDHHRGSVGALGHQRECLGDRLVRGQLDGGVEHQVPRLHVAHHVGHDRRRDVLRDHHDAATPGDGLGHPLAGDRGHVRDHDRERRAGAVRGGQVDVVPAGDRGAPRDHEHVVVGQVVRWGGVEELHDNQPRVAVCDVLGAGHPAG